ncbi:MAG: single-stranded DNA-binding protein [Microcoleaceae cyanobacterium]
MGSVQALCLLLLSIDFQGHRIMNNCILMVEILQEPQLRYTSDNQLPIAEMMVRFAGLRPTDPPATLKVIGWGNLAQDISATYHQGDQVVVEGRLGMVSVERPEGFKEKRAELTAQRVYAVDALSTSSLAGETQPAGLAGEPAPSNVVPLGTRTRPTPEVDPFPQPSPAAQPLNPPMPETPDDPDYDPIPF